MANYNTSANVVLTMNGKQASNMLSLLEKEAEKLRKKIDAAANAGDKASMNKFRAELINVNKTMDQLKGNAFSVEKVLKSLDTASPKELQRAFRKLKQELNGIERGSEAWNKHISMIKRVKAEIDSLNSSMKVQQSWWDRFKGWLNGCGTALLGFTASVTGLIMAGKDAVSAYADMEQEMANVRKYTGMSQEQVNSLNEEFKKIDTRSGREELNKLAQEAGRLGKTETEDILGYVRAADKVNVALDDLGENATLTLSKLTNVFGDEKRLGTEQALLSVGSVINELSQNCSASAPYIAEFTSRLGGVGSQAGMTVQQIMAFAAVLDSANQPVEAASTALSQVIVRIYKDPAKYAEVAGLDVQKFANLVRTDMNAALIELLSTLNNAGGMNKLSPMFADMGEKGSRSIQTLATLAGHIEEVKSQQNVANQAFSEAVSIDKEFDVQNNTVSAGLDKKKNELHEIAVELGEKLLPVMELFYSSSSLALKVLSSLVNFFIKYKQEIIICTSAIVAYNVVLRLHNNLNLLAARSATLMHGALKLVKGVLPVVKVLMASLTNAVQYLTNGLYVNYDMQQRWQKAMGAMKFSHWTALVIAFGAAIGSLVSRYNDNIRKMREQREEMRNLQKESSDYSSKAVDIYSKEIAKLEALYKAATDENRSRKMRIEAAKELKNLYPDIFAQYSTEEIMLRKAEKAYNDLTAAIIKKAKAQAAAELFKDNFKKILELDIQIDQTLDAEKDARRQKAKIEKRNEKRRADQKKNKQAESMVGALVMNQTGGAGGTSLDGRGNMESTRDARRTIEARQREVKGLREQKQIISDANEVIIKQFQDDEEFQKQIISDDGSGKTGTGAISGSGTGSGSGSDESAGTGKAGRDTIDKFAKEKEWREQQEAQASIDYRTGEKDYAEYTERMDAIAVAFYKKQLEHSDLGQTERLKIQAQYHEAVARQSENAQRLSLQQIEDEYAEKQRTLKQNYVDGLISKETYDLRTQEAETEHQHRLSQCMEISEENRLKAQDKYNDLLLRNREKAHQEFIDSVQRLVKEAKEHQDKLNKVKQDVFGPNLDERNTEYAAQLALLNTVYNRELAAAQDNANEKLRIEKAYQEALKKLREKYMQDGDSDGGMEGITEKIKKWLDSDKGKALTESMSAVTSAMSSIFSQLTSSIQADLEMQTAAINKRYDDEISRAEGNSYMVAQLEKRKQSEIAEVKNEANRKMFAMQVIQAVAQTAQNAISAYGSALTIPLIGHIIAPIAAAAAIAAGTLQINAIKKQAQASEAQGYEQGGFTKPGRKDEPAGIVHAGEWVAPQRLVNSPVTRPLINALEMARKNNTVGFISHLDVSRAITAPMVMTASRHNTAPPLATLSTGTPTQDKTAHELADTIKKLEKRLNMPFYTVNAVTGEHGMEKAQKEYKRLLGNKSPNRKRNSR